eukprot:GHVR01073378.1.p1 GENE.GHVR01073378.1~~GHVR01073378.1.p1  ORF type:complete len:363 (+),score=149.32 GHVR01073378.1:48-1136(+)
MKAAAPFVEKAAAGLKGMISMISTSETHLFDEDKFSQHHLRIALEKGSVEQKIDAMKRILAGLSVGRDVSSMWCQVVQCMSLDNLELRRLVYMFIVAHTNKHFYNDINYNNDINCFNYNNNDINYNNNNDDSAASPRNIALCSANLLKKAMQEGSQLRRAAALKAMTSIRVLEIVPLLVEAVNIGSKDLSPFVKKQTALSIPRVIEIDRDTYDSLTRILVVLGDDGDVCVCGAAIQSFREAVFRYTHTHTHTHTHTNKQTQPDPNSSIQLKFAELLPLYRRLCVRLPHMESPAQVYVIDVLLRICFFFFRRITHTEALELLHSHSHTHTHIHTYTHKYRRTYFKGHTHTHTHKHLCSRSRRG